MTTTTKTQKRYKAWTEIPAHCDYAQAMPSPERCEYWIARWTPQGATVRIHRERDQTFAMPLN